MNVPESKAKKEWMKNNTTMISVKLTNNTDADIIKYLSRFENRQGEIKRLIRKAIAEEQSK